MNPLPAHVAALQPYVSARSVRKGDRWLFMDANESPCDLDAPAPVLPPLSRYPWQRKTALLRRHWP